MNKNGKIAAFILVLSLIANGFLGFKYFKAKYKYNPDYSFDRKSLFEHLGIDSNSMVFAGNSLTAQFELTELLKNQNIRNRGINGDRSDGLLLRLPTLIQSHPRKLFLEIGINDIGQNFDNAAILANYTKILEQTQQQSPNTKIYVQSILPILSSGPAIKNTGLKNETVVEINKSLQDYCKAHNITFINLHDKFLLNGEMDPKYCIADGLHISGEGYLLWASLVKEYID